MFPKEQSFHGAMRRKRNTSEAVGGKPRTWEWKNGGWMAAVSESRDGGILEGHMSRGSSVCP